MLTEEKILDKIEIFNNNIFIREKVIVKRDGVEIASNYNRTSFSPGDDISMQDPKLIAIAATIWTNLTSSEMSGTLP
jgi:hypothetical protein